MRRAHEQVIQRNNALIRHFRQEQQELKQPDNDQGSERKGGNLSHHKNSDMPAAAQPAQDVLARMDMHSGVDRQAEASSAVRVAGALISSAAHAEREREREREISEADTGAQTARAAAAPASAPGVVTDRHKMKLTFILIGTNAHLMHARQLKNFRTQVLLHSLSSLDPGMKGLQSL